MGRGDSFLVGLLGALSTLCFLHLLNYSFAIYRGFGGISTHTPEELCRALLNIQTGSSADEGRGQGASCSRPLRSKGPHKLRP